MAAQQAETVVYAHQTPVVEASTRRPGRTNKTQLKLFEAAMDIMSEGGPTATTVEDIAERAGVSKGTVYYNFGSKKTMIDQLLQYGAKLLLAEMTTVASNHDDPREALRSALHAAIIYLSEHPGFARLWVSELWRAGADWSPTTDLIRADIMRFIRELISRLATRYTVRTDRSIEGVSLIIFGAVFMLSMDETRHGAERTPDEGAELAMLTIDGYIQG
ncbi:TetR/AcrR family transcriptional regulator [Rothia sp. SD9660Na]|uniref:TetR/AcrR family transcriptional regulator n=1 Tax=Rothia sp. SD9660Na TaxID=3047030 RepID=UPI0024B8AAA1|nr:TetR/AcrR family transcriptional regulator [Rothia sp. SD9660Na]WHS50680.1 TetR/AcrR family transcriptional regulator [Rothia sp. SD9660Na]